MTPEKGQHVRCFMRQGAMVLEGLVEEWSDAQVVLKSLGGESLMIIHRPLEDIMITKLVLKEIFEEIQSEIIRKNEPDTSDQVEIKATLQEVLNFDAEEPDLNKANLKKLRALVMEQDKKIITQKRREHFGASGASKMAVPYTDQIDLGPLKRK